MAKNTYVLALDQGTTGTHVSILDARLKVVGRAYRELPQHFPKPSWVEHDLNEMWSASEACMAQALKNAGLKGQALSAIGITNQRETTGLWSRDSGKPVGRALVWQDRRTSGLCAELKAQGKEARVREKTGLVLDPYFSATKLTWMFTHLKGVRARAERGDLCFGTVDSWLTYQLTGGEAHVTDVSNASRTLLMDLEKLSWDDEMCALFDVPRACLPRIASSSEIYGHTRGVKGLPDGIPVAGMAGDQQAALFGQACFSPGDSKCTFGTGAFLLMNTGAQPVRSTAGLLSTVAWRLGAQTTYALEGSAFVAGAAVQWLRDGLKLIKRASDIDALAATVKDTGDVVFVPALAGLGAPHWKPDSRGLIAGVDRSTTGAHLARATLEGIAFQIHDLAEAMRKDSGRTLTSFKVDGGAAASNLMMQFQADLLGIPVVRPQNLETTSLGAAFLAGLGAGVWQSPEDIRRVWKAEKTFKPKMKAEARAKHLAKWHQAVDKA